MALFGLDLDGPLLPNVDDYINPTKDDDDHRIALNAVVVNIHRSGPGAFERLVSADLGAYLSNADSKVRERATLLLAELLTRLPKLPLSTASISRLVEFFSSRLGDYPSVVPALKALSGLLKNHSPALLEAQQTATSSDPPAPTPTNASETAADVRSLTRCGSIEVIARGVFEELHVPALSQSIREAALSVLRALVTERDFREALSSSMGAAFVVGLVRCLEGEKDPRSLIVGLSTLRLIQQEGFDPAVLEETSEAVFDATACYFPVTFTPPPNDPYKISPETLKTDMEGVLVGSPGMARHVLPMFLDKLSSEVSTAKEAALKGLIAAVRAFGVPRVGAHLRSIGDAMFQEAVKGGDPDLAALALESLTEVMRETATHAELTGLGEACHEWRLLVLPLTKGAAREVAGDQPCSVLGRGSARILQALAASSALGLQSALGTAVPQLLKARADATSALQTAETSQEARVGGGAASAVEADDEQAARLAALAGLVAAVNSEVDFSGRKDGAPLEAFAERLLSEFSAALTGRHGSGGVNTEMVADEEAGMGDGKRGNRSGTPSSRPSPGSTATICIAACGLSDLVTRPPVPVLGEDQVASIIALLSAALTAPGAWGDNEDRSSGGIEDGAPGVSSAVEGTVAFVVLAALRRIGLRRTQYGRIVLEAVVPYLVERLPHGLFYHLSSSSSFAAVDRDSEGGAATERALSTLVELSDIPGVFAIAASAMLAEATVSTDGVDGGRRVLRGTRTSQLALVALDDALKRAVKRGNDAELLGFIRGAAPPRLPPLSTSFVPSQVTPSSSYNSTANVPTKPLAAGAEEDGNEPRGLPLLLEALGSSSSSAPRPSDADGYSGSRRDRRCLSQGSVIQRYPSTMKAVSAVRTCARAAPADEQDALLSSLLSRLLVPRLDAAADGDKSANISAGAGLAGKPVQVSVLSAVVGAVRLESKVLGEGGIAAAAVPVLLNGALAEGSAGLGYDGERNNAGSSGGASEAVGEAVAPCCQCLATVLNKLAPDSSLDSSVGLVIDALREAFATEVTPVYRGGNGVERGDAMGVEGGESPAECHRQGGGAWPVQCLAWATKAVAMRGGLSTAFSTFLEMLCVLALDNGDGDGGGGGGGIKSLSRAGRNGVALAAASAFGVVMRDEGEALRMGGDRGGFRVSPLWRQKFFVQTFPKLLAVVRGPVVEVTSSARKTRAGEGDAPRSVDMSDEEGLVAASSGGVRKGGCIPTPSTTCARSGASGRVPALLALLHVIRGVPPEALSQELVEVVAAVVQALGSEYPPLRTAALETFQALSRDYLSAFGQHLSSVIPLLLSLAEGRGGSVRSVGSGGQEKKPGREAVEAQKEIGALSRYRAVQCLTTLAALPYHRLHPFKTQVTRRLRDPLDDDRRAVRQAAVKSRNVWFLLS